MNITIKKYGVKIMGSMLSRQSQKKAESAVDASFLDTKIYLPIQAYKVLAPSDQAVNSMPSEVSFMALNIRELLKMFESYSNGVHNLLDIKEDQEIVNVALILRRKGIDIPKDLSPEILTLLSKTAPISKDLIQEPKKEVSQTNAAIPSTIEIVNPEHIDVQHSLQEEDISDALSDAASSICSRPSSASSSRNSSSANLTASADRHQKPKERSSKIRRESTDKDSNKGREKVEKIMLQVMSPYRIFVINKLKRLLENRESFNNITEVEVPALVRCIQQIIIELLRDTANQDSNESTSSIIQKLASLHLDNSAGRLTSFLRDISNSSDARPVVSQKDLITFLSRLGIAFSGKINYFFDPFFDDSLIQLDNKFQELGKEFKTITSNIVVKLSEAVLTPHCLACLHILRQSEGVPSSVTEADRYHLIASLIYETVFNEKSVDDVLGNALSYLHSYLDAELKTQYGESIPNDSLPNEPSLEEKRDFAACMSYVINELPRQLLSSNSGQNLVAIAQGPQIKTISKSLYMAAKRLKEIIDKQKIQQLSPVVEVSQENTPQTPLTREATGLPNLKAVARHLTFSENGKGQPATNAEDEKVPLRSLDA